jgi:hypothetical protein
LAQSGNWTQLPFGSFALQCVTAIGGIGQAKKIASLGEILGVKIAFQEGGENDPVRLRALPGAKYCFASQETVGDEMALEGRAGRRGR